MLAWKCRCGHGFIHHRNDLDTDDWGTGHLDRTSFFSFLQFVITAGTTILVSAKYATLNKVPCLHKANLGQGLPSLQRLRGMPQRPWES